jgi:hypothetical protein
MKITKEDLLNSEFLKQFKDSGELDGFLSELHMDIPVYTDPCTGDSDPLEGFSFIKNSMV